MFIILEMIKKISVHDYLRSSQVLRQKTGRVMQINFKKSDDPEFLTNNPNRRFRFD